MFRGPQKTIKKICKVLWAEKKSPLLSIIMKTEYSTNPEFYKWIWGNSLLCHYVIIGLALDCINLNIIQVKTTPFQAEEHPHKRLSKLNNILEEKMF